MDNDDSAMLHGKAMITNNLSMLVKNKCMVSANLGGKDSLLTAIIAIDHKDGTLTLDYGASDFLNKKMVSTPNVRFTTTFNGIQVAFTAGKITKVRYKGEDAFVTPIPNSLYWYNRREYYRVNTPIMNPTFCDITLTVPSDNTPVEYKRAYDAATAVIKSQLEAKIQAELLAEQQAFIKAYAKMSVESKIKAKLERQKLEAEREANPIVPDEDLINIIRLPLHDISLSGCSMTNYNQEFSYFLTLGTICESVTLVTPNEAEIPIEFEVMMKRTDSMHKAGEFAELVGVKFANLRHSAESAVMRHVQDIERQSGIMNT